MKTAIRLRMSCPEGERLHSINQFLFGHDHLATWCQGCMAVRLGEAEVVKAPGHVGSQGVYGLCFVYGHSGKAEDYDCR